MAEFPHTWFDVCCWIQARPGMPAWQVTEIRSIRLQNQRIETTKLDQTKNRLIALWQKIFIKHWV